MSLQSSSNKRLCARVPNVPSFLWCELQEDEMNDGWDIAVNGAYHSRGFIATFCEVSAVNLKARPCLHIEVVHSLETGNSSQMQLYRLMAEVMLWKYRLMAEVYGSLVDAWKRGISPPRFFGLLNDTSRSAQSQQIHMHISSGWGWSEHHIVVRREMLFWPLAYRWELGQTSTGGNL